MMYGDFAYIYDKLMYDLDYKKIYKFILEVLNDKNLEPKIILEMACGTGELTEHLVDKFEVHAFDLSYDMLSVCENKIKNKRLKLFRQDMTNFKAPTNYDAIFSVGDSLNYVIEKVGFESALKSAYEHLNEDGILIFDLNTEYKFKNISPVTVDEVDEVFYVWENIYDEEKKLNTYGINFFVNTERDLYERFYEEHVERAYSIDYVLSFLEEIGYKDIEVYDDYEKNEISEETNRYTIIARK
ncbi:class I SAM-dependent methyltransferase [Peptoniphilus sp. MSJ-1]|uniref:Class I SAM-dependent methyltransferase n=1 Tax=Peptoniphilus ovalis TaxID=2841503 RepID=A0ABS6FHZ6_9FIRM|nr:class I SAM-dependent methyltransferase [Peptoniphilus ovalis]MBU5669803.1 class I SAM-dependent methyltransferase [Peptoniphilus ovalis]